MMTLAVAAVSVLLWRSEYILVDADTSNSTVPIGNLKSPALTSSEIETIRYRETPVSLPDAGATTCHRSSSSGYTTCFVNSLPAFPSP
jgi:hypothetical protein